jgi:hypothetical protein
MTAVARNQQLSTFEIVDLPHDALSMPNQLRRGVSSAHWAASKVFWIPVACSNSAFPVGSDCQLLVYEQ